MSEMGHVLDSDGDLCPFELTLEWLFRHFEERLTEPTGEDAHVPKLGQDLLRLWAQPFRLYLQDQQWVTYPNSKPYSELQQELNALEMAMKCCTAAYFDSVADELKAATTCLVSINWLRCCILLRRADPQRWPQKPN